MTKFQTTSLLRPKFNLKTNRPRTQSVSHGGQTKLATAYTGHWQKFLNAR